MAGHACDVMTSFGRAQDGAHDHSACAPENPPANRDGHGPGHLEQSAAVTFPEGQM